jgi:hypothetical protein
MATMSARGVNLEQGEAISLLNVVAAGDTVGTNGTAVQILGERLAYVWILNVTSAAAAAGDLLDVYIDTLFGAATWINIARFTRVLGNGGAKAYFTVTVPTNMTTTDDVSADCAAGVSRGVVGSQFRGRYVITDGGAHGEVFSFTLTGYAL